MFDYQKCSVNAFKKQIDKIIAENKQKNDVGYVPKSIILAELGLGFLHKYFQKLNSSNTLFGAEKANLLATAFANQEQVLLEVLLDNSYAESAVDRKYQRETKRYAEKIIFMQYARPYLLEVQSDAINTMVEEIKNRINIDITPNNTPILSFEEMINNGNK